MGKKYLGKLKGFFVLDIDYKYIDELFDLKTVDFKVGYKSEDYHRLHELFDKKYNIGNYEFSFDYCCSSLIERLFKKYVTEDTIVIHSKRDHPSVFKCLEKFPCKELICLDHGYYLQDGLRKDPRTERTDITKEFSIRKFQKRLQRKDYSNIFFLSYGSNVCDGEVRDNRIFQRIFKLCDEYCKNIIKVLDDCQGSMWIDRDYSIYDYVLWTAHATLSCFDVGVLISAPNMPIIGTYHIGEEYLYDNYRRLLMNEEFAHNWNKYLSLATGVNLSCAPHLFNLKLTKDYPESYFRALQKGKSNISEPVDIHVEAQRFIRLRVEQFMGKKGKYRLLRALRFILDEREFIEA